MHVRSQGSKRHGGRCERDRGLQRGPASRTDAIAGTLGAPAGIPALGATYQLGVDTVTALRNRQTLTWHITTNTISETRTTYNVSTDSPWGDPKRTVVVSAHNDSVAAGPGINADGSGTASAPAWRRGPAAAHHVRFLWVGAEEEGLLGSNFYVASLSEVERSKIIAMLDFDMVASPNYARQVYDPTGRRSAPTSPGPTARA